MPLILRTAMRGWPALNTWSFEFFAAAFDDFPVVAHAPQFPACAGWAVKTRLAAYVAYLRDPSAAAIEGTWTRGDGESHLASTVVEYNVATALHPQDYSDLSLRLRVLPSGKVDADELTLSSVYGLDHGLLWDRLATEVPADHPRERDGPVLRTWRR